MTIDELKQLYNMTWEFRAEMQDDFPTPPPDDAMDFAYTEGVGESLSAAHGWPDELDAAMVFSSKLLDAEVRKNLTYKRNNAKEHSVERELTQCAMMLLTAIPDKRCLDDVRLYPLVFTWQPRNIAIRVAKCVEVPSDYAYIIQTVAAINTAVNLSETLPAELDRMRAKHKSSNGHGGALVDVRRVGQLAIADYTEGNGVE